MSNASFLGDVRLIKVVSEIKYSHRILAILAKSSRICHNLQQTGSFITTLQLRLTLDSIYDSWNVFNLFQNNLFQFYGLVLDALKCKSSKSKSPIQIKITHKISDYFFQNYDLFSFN